MGVCQGYFVSSIVDKPGMPRCVPAVGAPRTGVDMNTATRLKQLMSARDARHHKPNSCQIASTFAFTSGVM